ncbi:hypothetical protein C8F01DRAFT_1231750 [Mycena amicta]|nr:hypothetical protein C8F01DRAFT_1231750 [Mycena amicta]
MPSRRSLVVEARSRVNGTSERSHFTKEAGPLFIKRPRKAERLHSIGRVKREREPATRSREPFRSEFGQRSRISEICWFQWFRRVKVQLCPQSRSSHDKRQGEEAADFADGMSRRRSFRGRYREESEGTERIFQRTIPLARHGGQKQKCHAVIDVTVTVTAPSRPRPSFATPLFIRLLLGRATVKTFTPTAGHHPNASLGWLVQALSNDLCDEIRDALVLGKDARHGTSRPAEIILDDCFGLPRRDEKADVDVDASDSERAEYYPSRNGHPILSFASDLLSRIASWAWATYVNLKRSGLAIQAPLDLTCSDKSSG